MSQARQAAGIIFRGAALSLILRVLGTIAAVGAHVALARALTLQDYGIYVYVLQVVGMFATVGALGMSELAIRVIPESVVRDDADLRLSFIYTGVAIAFVVCALLFGLAYWASFSDLNNTVVGTLFSLPVGALFVSYVLLRFFQEVARADRRIGTSQIFEQIAIPLVVVIASFFIPTSGSFIGGELEWIIIVQFLTATGVCIFLFFLSTTRGRSSSQVDVIRKPGSRVGRLLNWLRSGLPLGGATLLVTATSRADLVALAFFAPAGELAVYGAAARIAGLMIFGLAAVNAIAAPVFSSSWHSGDMEKLQEEARTATALSAVYTFPVFLVLMFAPQYILNLFGTEFTNAKDILRILAVGGLVNAFTGPVGPLMIATGQYKQYLGYTAISLITAVVLLASFYNVFGLHGAALGTALGVIVVNLLLAWHMWKSTGIIAVLDPLGVRDLFLQVVERFRTLRSF